jgi:hypothetical protein
LPCRFQRIVRRAHPFMAGFEIGIPFGRAFSMHRIGKCKEIAASAGG